MNITLSDKPELIKRSRAFAKAHGTPLNQMRALDVIGGYVTERLAQ